MAVPPLGKPPRFLGLKITSNRIESVLVLFVFICLSLIFLANNMINFSKLFEQFSDFHFFRKFEQLNILMFFANLIF